MIQTNLPCQFTITFLHKALHHHVISSRPYATLPITAILLVLGIIGRQRRNTVFPVECGRIIQFLHHTIQLYRIQYISKQSPIGTYSLGCTERTVSILVIKETGLFIPKIVMDIFSQHFGFVFKLFYLLPTFQIKAHLK